jgi:hypothetical protein
MKLLERFTTPQAPVAVVLIRLKAGSVFFVEGKEHKRMKFSNLTSSTLSVDVAGERVTGNRGWL